MILGLLKLNPDAWYELWVPFRDFLDRRGLLPEVRRIQRPKPIPMLCPNCGCGVPKVLPRDAERGDFDTVTCPECWYRTDMYEAQCAAERATPLGCGGEDGLGGLTAEEAIKALEETKYPR